MVKCASRDFVSPMTKISKVSLVDATVEVLREGLMSGRWRTKLPSQRNLAKELGVSRRTLGDAISRLVKDGVISSAGLRRAHLIPQAPPAGTKPVAGPAKPRQLRVALLTMIPLVDMITEQRENVFRILTDLQHAGHHGLMIAFPKGKNPHKTGYLGKIMKESRPDAWLVLNGTNEILRWFAASGSPAMALGGRSRGLPLASVGADMMPFIADVLGRLTGLGHRRIVLIAPKPWRHPEPSPVIVEFRRKLNEAGVTPGEYHTPDWEETPEGLEKLLGELFRVTPPTAILCWSEHTDYGVQAWMKGRGLRSPSDVSLVSLWNDVACDWCMPGVRIVRPSDSADTIFYRRIRSWIHGVATGRPDNKQILPALCLDEGNSIGPPPM